MTTVLNLVITLGMLVVVPLGLRLIPGLVSPAVATTALVAERAGYPLFGFPLRTLSLAVAHFDFAGFTAALVAGLVCTSTSDSPRARLAAVCVLGGTAAVFVGFFVGDAIELAGAAMLTAGLWLAAFVIWRDVFPGVTDRATRLLLGTSAAGPRARRRFRAGRQGRSARLAPREGARPGAEHDREAAWLS